MSRAAGGVRSHLAHALDWSHAHAGFDAAVKDFPPALRGTRVEGLPHSAWEVLEHLRIAQHDILDFSRNPKYTAMKWPDDYWPPTPGPPDEAAWDRSVAAFRRDRAAMKRLASNPKLKLDKRIPHGTGQTYLREILLVIDHNAYHVAELVLLRRLLGAWT
jgi:DinB superfamily